MKEIDIAKSIEERKIHLTSEEKFDHWLNFLFLMIPISLMGYANLNSAIHNYEFTLGILVCIIITALLIRHKLNSTKLDVYKTKLSIENFNEANCAASELNNWTIKANTNDYFEAIKYAGWQWDGIKITAILKNNKIYLNSMVNPSSRSNPFTLGLNKKNKDELIIQYQLITKGVNVGEIVKNKLAKNDKEFWDESELSPKNLGMKLIAYPVGIVFALGAIWMIISLEITSVIYGLIVLGLVGTYFYLDFKVILEKRRRKRKKTGL